MDTLSSGDIEAAESVAAKIGQGATKAAANPRDVSLLEPRRFSVLDFLSRSSGVASMMAWIGAPIIMRVSGWKWPRKIVGNRVPNVVGKVAALNDAELGSLRHEVAEASRFAARELPVAEPAITLVSSAFRKTHDGVARFARKTLSAQTLQKLSETSVSNAIFSGTMIVGEGASVAMNSARRIRVLRQMQADLNPGKPTPSTWAVLMGSHLNPLVLQARNELTGKKAVLSTLLQLGGMVGTALLMVFDRSKGTFGPVVKQMGLSMGTGMVGSMLTSGNTALAAYDSLHQSFVQTGRAGLENYVGVIGGFAKNANDQMVQKFARQCFTEQVKPAELLRRIEVFRKSLSAKPAGGRMKASTPTVGIHTAGVNARRADQAAAVSNTVSPA